MIWGKIIGVLAGLKMAGPIGALAGGLVGHWVDLRLSALFRGKVFGGTARAAARAAERQRIFSTSVVNLAAKLAKADGTVTREEVDAFKAQFSIPPSQMAAIGALYDQAKQSAEGYEFHARRLTQAFAGEPMVLIEVLGALHRIALADGQLHPAERDFLNSVAAIFGLVQQRPFAERAADLADDDPYEIIGAKRGAPFAEIKAAWRRMTREHHPDTLMAKGMPQEYIELATKKMAQINAAYDRIRAERGEN